MVKPANRHGEAVADLTSHRPLRCELDVMRIRRGATTNETRLGGHKPQVVAIALTNWLADERDRVRSGSLLPAADGSIRAADRTRRRSRVAEVGQPFGEGRFHRPRIRCKETVFERENAVCPGRKSLGAMELLKFRH